MSKPVGVVFLALSASIAFSQNAPQPRGSIQQPTGIQNIGSLGFSRTESMVSLGMGMAPVEAIQEMFIGGFATYDYTNYVPATLSVQTTTIGPCTLGTSSGPPVSMGTPPVITPIDAGPLLNITGPNGTQQAMKLPNPKMIGATAYSATLGGGIPLPPLPFPIPGLSGPKPLWLDPGNYTVDNGAGGADVGAFTAMMTLPARFAWTNAASDLTVTLASGVDIQWTGGDPNAMVEIQGAVTTCLSPVAGASFSCIVPNTGEFMVTPDVLSMMSPTPAGSSSILSTLSTLTVGTFGQGTYSAPVISYQDGWVRQVVYQ